MQAWEQQVAVLSRQLSKVTADKEDADRERQALLDSLRASEQVGPLPGKAALSRSLSLSPMQGLFCTDSSNDTVGYGCS